MPVALMAPWCYAQSEVANSTSADGKFGRFEVGSLFKAPANLVGQQSRMIFYRTNTSDFKGAPTINFSGMYHPTLPRNAFSRLCASPWVANVEVKSITAAARNKPSLESVSAMTLKVGSNQYMRVVENQGLKVLQFVVEQEAFAELSKSHEQVHTISRITPAQACRTVLAQVTRTSPQVNTAAQDAKPANVSGQTISLGADALFDFAGSYLKALGSQGRVALNKFITKVMSKYSSFQRINVLVSADTIGKFSVNNRLPKDRAQTVRDYLKENGLQTTFITSEWRGSKALVKSACGPKTTVEDIACKASNQRVKVVINDVVR
jgi:outer membrane protein OmpA-like peptidoglycan-associated protein